MACRSGHHSFIVRPGHHGLVVRPCHYGLTRSGHHGGLDGGLGVAGGPVADGAVGQPPGVLGLVVGGGLSLDQGGNSEVNKIMKVNKYTLKKESKVKKL